MGCVYSCSIRKAKETLNGLNTSNKAAQKRLDDLTQSVKDEEQKLEAAQTKAASTKATLRAEIERLQAAKATHDNSLRVVTEQLEKDRAIVQNICHNLRTLEDDIKSRQEGLEEQEVKSSELTSLVQAAEKRMPEIIDETKMQVAIIAGTCGREERPIPDDEVVRVAMTGGDTIDILAEDLRRTSGYFKSMLDTPSLIPRNRDDDIYVVGDPECLRGILMRSQGDMPLDPSKTKLEWLRFLHEHPHFIYPFQKVFEGTAHYDPTKRHYDPQIQRAMDQMKACVRRYRSAWDRLMTSLDVRHKIFDDVFASTPPKFPCIEVSFGRHRSFIRWEMWTQWPLHQRGSYRVEPTARQLEAARFQLTEELFHMRKGDLPPRLQLEKGFMSAKFNKMLYEMCLEFKYVPRSWEDFSRHVRIPDDMVKTKAVETVTRSIVGNDDMICAAIQKGELVLDE
jgi:hypothetical protein